MKKTFLLQVEGKNRDRLLDASKHDIRKYVKRERSKALPEGADFLDFDCKLGANQAESSGVHFAALMPAIDALAASGCQQFYVEVVAKLGHRTAKPAAEQISTALPSPEQL